MKKCFECGNELSDEALTCPKCGAPQPSSSQIHPKENTFLPIVQTTNTWDNPVFSLFPFISSLLFGIGSLIFLITTFIIGEFTFAGVVLLLAAIANLVASLPNFIKLITKTNHLKFNNYGTRTL